jgi:membrane associated rhomboid family serine protease
MKITDELRAIVKSGGIVTKLIAINLTIFVLVNLITVFLFLFNNHEAERLIIHLLAVPANLPELTKTPWTIFTYMFLHENFLHVLFNMLWLYWFGLIFLRYFSVRQLTGLYILGGLLGAIVYILSFNIFPVFEQYKFASYAMGASASVIAIVIATAYYVPNFTVHLVFIGAVKLKWIALVMLILDIIGIASNNSGGHLAHLGGAIMGWLFIVACREKIDLTSWVKWFENLFSKQTKKKEPHLNVSYRRNETEYEYNQRKNDNQKVIDTILDKISKNGYDSLTTKEKEILFSSSKQKVN